MVPGSKAYGLNSRTLSVLASLNVLPSYIVSINLLTSHKAFIVHIWGVDSGVVDSIGTINDVIFVFKLLILFFYLIVFYLTVVTHTKPCYEGEGNQMSPWGGSSKVLVLRSRPSPEFPSTLSQKATRSNPTSCLQNSISIEVSKDF